MAKLTRALAAESLVANIYYNGVEAVENGFDAKKPWSDIKEIVDKYGNVWIQIPKFYTKYVLDETGAIKERYISEFNGGTGWHLNPLFKNSQGKEIDYVQISKYLLSVSSGKVYSKSGESPIFKQFPATVRTQIDAYEDEDTFGYEHSSFDIWALIALQDLCIVEFATSDVTSVVKGKTISFYQNGGIDKNGTTDNVGVAEVQTTGTAATSASLDDGRSCMKYRGLENLWGNGRLFIDGIQIRNGKVYYCTNPANYSDNTAYIESAITPTHDSGVVHQLCFDENSGLVLPKTVKESGSYGDYCSIPKDVANGYFYLGGDGTRQGLYSFQTGLVNATSAYNYSVFRMIRKPE